MNTPLKANQVRSHTNKQGKSNIYIVVADGAEATDKTFNIVWFRGKADGEMYLVRNIIKKARWDLTADPVIMDNFNEVGTKFREMMSGEHEVKTHLKNGELVKAIKAHRANTGMGLKEAKEEVEKMRDELYADGTLFRPSHEN